MQQIFIRLAAGNIRKETEKAVCLAVNNAEVWLPKSQITILSNKAIEEYCRPYIVVMPIWLAKNKGFWGYNSFGQAVSNLVESANEVLVNLPEYSVYC